MLSKQSQQDFLWCTGLDLSLANLIYKELPTTNWIQLTAHLGFEPMDFNVQLDVR